MPHELDSLDTVVRAIVELDPQPRPRRWISLSFCVLDAVWSLGARYDAVVVPAIKRFAEKHDISEPTIPASDDLPDDPCPSATLAATDVDELIAVTNKQRTSTRSGILKAEASIRYAQILSAHEVETLSDATSLIADPDKLAAVDADLAKVPGDGHHGIRRGYLWMLVGDDDRIKPDRMVRRWFSDLGVPVDPQLAKDYILAAAPVCSEQLDRKVTPWEIDHAIWLATRP
ncbi:hypothetical protein ACWPN4_14020 [Gordonia polyisoprenivorans]